MAMAAPVLALCVLLLPPPALLLPADSMPAAGPAAAGGSAQSPEMAQLPAQPAQPSSQNVSAFFPQIKGDLSKVTWAHAVNSQTLLDKALNDSVMMLEADVIMGTTPEHPSTTVPVMGHPPSNTSDLSLEDFLRRIVSYNKDNADKRRGVKLDFKSIEVFEKSMQFMKSTFSATPAFPVWLNADILAGPVEATAVPVDAHRFLTAAKTDYPDLTLSLGWTTRWGAGLANTTVPQAEAKYTEAHIQSMLTSLKSTNVTQPITYAVRAAFVAHSKDVLKKLLDETPQESGKATLTIWSSDATDEIDVDMLRSNIKSLGKSSIYIDVGEDLAKKLSSSAAAVYASLATTLMAVLVVLRGL